MKEKVARPHPPLRWGRPIGAGLNAGCHIQPRPSQHNVPEGLHVGHGVGQRRVGVNVGFERPNGLRGVYDGHPRRLQSRRMCAQAVVRAGTRNGLCQLLAQQLKAFPFEHANLSSQQVHCLNTVRSLMNHVETVIAPILFYGVVAGVAIPPMNLYCQ